MILEISDITGQEKAVGHFDMPPGMTLGDIVAKDPKISKLQESVAYADINGQRVDNWAALSPNKGDHVRLKLKPGGPLLPFIPIIIEVLKVLSAILSVVRFITSLFSSPQTPKSGGSGGKQSPTYSFDGIRTVYGVGNPVPVIYGQHRVGGQMLQMAVDVTSGGKRQELSLLLGLGEGPITDVSCIEINDLALINVLSTSFDTRLGTQTQSIIPGFNQVRNTYFDGREVTSTSIVYTTIGNNIEKAQLNVSATQGLYTVHNNGRINNTTRYRVEYKHTTTSPDSYTTVASNKKFTARSIPEIFDKVEVDFGSKSTWDLRLTWLGATNVNPQLSGWRIWLKNTTEISEQTHSFSSTALLALRAIATNQLNGSQPQVTCVVRGLEVDQYNSSLAVASHGYSQNPAWGLLDYMTNSRYGAGAYISKSDINLQSFYDFSILCNSQMPDGKGGLQDQHHLDLVMDNKKSHWDWIQAILANYKSALIWSNGQYKIITDRADTPVRQVFHAGNTLREKTSVKMDSDPTRPNQATIEFANQDLDYELDTLFAQDSAAMAANEPIKNFDLSLIGVVRQGEILRAAEYQIRRHRDRRRTVSFATGLEGIVVEPGDFAKVGVINTDYEAGYGGRALDGSSSHILLDREVNLQNNNAYELLVWHSKTDSVETINLASATNTGRLISLTASFGAEVFPADRWAVGITSEDLMKIRVTNFKHNVETGIHEIIGEEFVSFQVTTPVLTSSDNLFLLNSPPPQPIGVSVAERAFRQNDGSIISMLDFEVTPSPLVEAGRITEPGTGNSVKLAAGSHNPIMNSLIGEHLRFISGSAAGATEYLIETWNSSTTIASVSPTFTLNPQSGDPYELKKKTGTFAGFEVYVDETNSGDFANYGTFTGYAGTVPIIPISGSAIQNAKIIPYSTLGVRNEIGPWVVPFQTRGDTVAPAQPVSISHEKGTGLDVTLKVVPTSEADLWGHLFYRHTANCFTNAQTIGFGSQMYHDSNITYETSYHYWAAPVDYSFNVGSWVGPTTVVVSRVITTDISTHSATRAQFQTGGTTPLNDSVAASSTIVASKMFLVSPRAPHCLIIFDCSLINNVAAKRDITLSMYRFRDSDAADAALDTLQTTIQGAVGDFAAASMVFVDSLPTGVSTLAYMVKGKTSGASGDVSAFARRFSVVELVR